MFYPGFIKNLEDALLIFEACLQGQVSNFARRMSDSEKERLIQPGRTFVWCQTKTGSMKRWTDGRRWSPSRIRGVFLVYSEKRRGGMEHQVVNIEEELMKKALSIEMKNGDIMHLTCYFKPCLIETAMSPSQDPAFQGLVADKSRYENMPRYVITRSSIMATILKTPDEARSAADQLFLQAASELKFSYGPASAESSDMSFRKQSFLNSDTSIRKHSFLSIDPTMQKPELGFDLTEITPATASISSSCSQLKDVTPTSFQTWNTWKPTMQSKKEKRLMDKMAIKFFLTQ